MAYQRIANVHRTLRFYLKSIFVESMSNYLGRKTDFTPSVYTRYFERSDTRKKSNGHIYFDDNEEPVSNSYQLKRDLLFKRIFPSKYADQNTNDNNEQFDILIVFFFLKYILLEQHKMVAIQHRIVPVNL